MYTIHAIAAVRMSCRMFCSQAYPYGRHIRLACALSMFKA